MTLEIKDKGVFRVENNAEHLQMWTESGWRLVAVLEEQDTMSVTDQVLTGPPQQYMGSAYGQPSQYANVTKYLPHVLCPTVARHNHNHGSCSFNAIFYTAVFFRS